MKHRHCCRTQCRTVQTAYCFCPLLRFLSYSLSLWRRHYECEGCNRVNYGYDPVTITTCQVCGKVNPETNKFFVVPIKGFRADIVRSTSKNVKPKKTFANEIQYIGNGKLEEIFTYNNKVNIVSGVD